MFSLSFFILVKLRWEGRSEGWAESGFVYFWSPNHSDRATMEDHIREAERIQHEIARQTAKAIWGTGLASAVISLLAVLLACWVAWEKRREKNEKKKKLEEEEKKKKKKTRADEEDEKRWNIAATQLQDIRYVMLRGRRHAKRGQC